MIVTYDTEFHDRPDGIIDLISIGMVAEDGRELYCVNREARWEQILTEPWLVENVVLPHLPCVVRNEMVAMRLTSRQMKAKREIAALVKAFLADTPDPDLWAYYSATDHVVGYQLFGSMIEASRDHGWPMRTSCLKQHEAMLERWLAQSMGISEERAREVLYDKTRPRPVQDPATEHHALHDARHDMALARWLGLVS